jgi:hypothetical protein
MLIRAKLRRRGIVRKSYFFALMLSSGSARWWEEERGERGKWEANVNNEDYGTEGQV